MRHVQPDGDRRSGTLSTSKLSAGSENRHLSVSRAQHRTQAVTIHNGAIKNTMKKFITVLGLASFISLFTVSHAGPITDRKYVIYSAVIPQGIQ
jgi:hypothetical protein